MASTIHDVARLAGVHASTVSRVLNQKATITAETKEKVFAAMRQLNFHPNSIARSLASGTAGVIGFVLDAGEERAYHNPFFSSSQFAIERVAQEHGCHVLVINGGTPSANRAENLLLEHRVDGLILPPSSANLSLLSQIDPSCYVLLGKPAAAGMEASWVDIDNEEGAAMAVRHLLGKGYRRIAFLGGERGEGGMDFIRRRTRGYRRALPPGTPPLILETDGTHEGACRAALARLGDKERPEAFVCNDNLCAFGLLRAARLAGLRVPENIGAVTFNNYPLAEFTDPPLTAVHIDTELLGQRTAELLFDQIKQKSTVRQILLPPKLIERASSGGRP